MKYLWQNNYSNKRKQGCQVNAHDAILTVVRLYRWREKKIYMKVYVKATKAESGMCQRAEHESIQCAEKRTIDQTKREQNREKKNEQK